MSAPDPRPRPFLSHLERSLPFGELEEEWRTKLRPPLGLPIAASLGLLAAALTHGWARYVALAAGFSFVWLQFMHTRLRLNKTLQARESLPAPAQGQTPQGQAIVEQLALRACPAAILIYDARGRIQFSNPLAEELFANGDSLMGQNFLKLLHQAPQAMRTALFDDRPGMFTIVGPSGEDSYHLAKRSFWDTGHEYTVLKITHFTRAVGQQQATIWKQAIRIISHELNNSLAPVKSLLHSARLIADKPEHHHKLETVFTTIEERASHLSEFLKGYAKFARLPPASPRRTPWLPVVEELQSLFPDIKLEHAGSKESYFDRPQLSQVLINLIKNAQESGSEPDAIAIEISSTTESGCKIVVKDGGTGMSDEVLRHAQLPFFTTKPEGSGLGLALCREIVAAHGGRLVFAKNEPRGTKVIVDLPGDKGAMDDDSLYNSQITLTQV